MSLERSLGYLSSEGSLADQDSPGALDTSSVSKADFFSFLLSLKAQRCLRPKTLPKERKAIGVE